MLFRSLPYVVARGLERYHITGSVPEATETMMGRIEVASEQQESELSMLRYLVWAIPSIGFIGTVRGSGVLSSSGVMRHTIPTLRLLKIASSRA